MAGVSRFQAEVSTEQMAELEKLAELGAITTKKELFNYALTLFKWAAKERQQGRAICSIDDQSGAIKELEMPALEAIAARARAERNAAEPTGSSSLSGDKGSAA